MITTLPNGLIVAVERVPGVKSAAFTFLIPRGAALDPEGQCGLSTLLAEMMARGAGERDARAISEAQDAIGLERHIDASQEALSFSGMLLSARLPDALDIFQDIILRPRLDPDELEASKELCLQSIAAIDDSPAERLFLELNRRYFPPPWNRPVKGIPAELAALEVENLREAVRGFSSRGLIVAIAGDIDPDAAAKEIAIRFGDFRGADGYPEPGWSAHTPAGGHVEDASKAQVQIGMAKPSLPMDHEDYPRVILAATILSAGMGSRLFVEVREKRGLVYSVKAWNMCRRGRGDIYGYAGTTPERAEETIAVMKGEFARLAEGVSAEELDRAKIQLKASVVMNFESPGLRASSMANDLLLLGRVRTPDEILASFLNISLEDLNSWLAKNPLDDFVVMTLGKGGAS